MINRRRFLKTSAAVAAAGLGSCAAKVDGGMVNQLNNELCVFTKPFNSLSFDELADSISKIGFDGIEAPIRRGGHVQSQEITERLPELVAALKKRDLKISVMTSDVNDAADQESERVLRTAAKEGIRFYRMKYFKYDESRSIKQQLVNWKSQVVDLAAMNRELGMTAVYQNHAGRNYFGAPIWDLAEVLEGVDPAEVAVAYDIRHATVEGGNSWPISFRLIQPHVKVVYVKDYEWRGAKVANVPLGDGLVSKTFFQILKELKFNGPISLHEEYLDHRKPELVPDHLAAMKKDLGVLKQWL
ncbi:MAG: TIM barrel protein [Fuerstiella sp.]